MSSAVAIVPAAGASSRFGSMKLLADIAGEPLLQHTLRHLLDAGIDRVIVVVAAGHQLGVVPLLQDARVSTVVNPDPARGMFSSIQSGLTVAEGDPIVVLPADMPFAGGATVVEVAEAARRLDATVVPSHAGRRGHPIAIPGRMRAALLAADPASHLKAALRAASGAPPVEWPVDDPGVLRDVDVPGDL
jgi:molybdenum cofactor cytidylyltransferase